MLDDAAQAFCRNTEYMQTRTAATVYLFNDWVRAGLNRSFGGALFELYGIGKRNLIEENGATAGQLSIGGYDGAGAGSGWFATKVCDPTPYPSADACKARNGGDDCRLFGSGAHVCDCAAMRPCADWTAGGPWHPLQAQAADCGWNGPSNDVTRMTAAVSGSSVTFTKQGPYHFTKTSAMAGMTWEVTAEVAQGLPLLKLTYRMTYAGPEAGEHNQELPALYTDARNAYWYYYYDGPKPYNDVWGQVTRRRADAATQLRLPSRTGPLPQPPPPSYAEATEEWMTVCDRSETWCMTQVSFAPQVKVFAQGGQNVTMLGRFALGRSFDQTWDVYLFPYHYANIVAGQSVREWIYQLKAGR